MNNIPPSSNNNISDSEIHSGRDTVVSHVTYHNTYLPGQSVEIPKHLTNFVPTVANHVLGRHDELKEMTEQLENGRPTVLVNGVGGMGKTTVATKYTVENRSRYTHFAWLTVTSSIVDAFVNNVELKDAIHITKDVNDLMAARNVAGAFTFLFKKLNDLDKTLVVIDNANDLTDLVQYQKLFNTARCHFILTSRNQPSGWHVVKIERLSDADAITLFGRHAPSVIAPETPLLALLKHLDFHTLLIELVAKSAHNSGISFDKLCEIIRQNFIHDPLLQKRKVETGEHGLSIEDNAKRAKVEEYVWLIFKNIATVSDSGKEILRAFALLPTATAHHEDFLEKHLQFFGITEDIFEQLDHLVEQGWLDAVRKDEKPHYLMHPIIADAVKKHLDVTVEFAEEYIMHIANLISYENTKPEHNLFEINTNRPLAERLKYLFFNENTEGVSWLLDTLGNLEKNFGFYELAAEYNERALAIAKRIFDANHYLIAVRQSNLANVYGYLGRYKEAANLLETAFKSDLKNLGEDNPSVSIRQSNLANAYGNLGRYEEAANLLETALESDLKNFGGEHPSVARCQSNLSAVYNVLGRYKEAANLSETSLESSMKNFGKEHPNVTVCQSNLANAYKNLGRHEEAANLLETALESSLKNFGIEHPNSAFCQWNLAVVYIKTNKKAEAKVLLQKAYQNFLKKFGAEHPRTIGVKTWLSSVS